MPVGSSGGGGGGAKPGDMRAGGAFVEVSLRDQLSKQLAGLKARASAFAAGMKAIGSRLVLVGGAALAPLTALFGGGVSRAENIKKSADAMGITIEQMQRLQYAADVAAVSVEDVLKAPQKYGDLMKNAPILDADTIKESVAASRALRSVWIELQLALAPLITSIGPAIRAFAEFVKQNAGYVRLAFIAAAVTTTVGVAFVALASGITSAIVVFGSLATAAKLAFMAITSPVGVVVGAIAAIGAAIVSHWVESTEEGQKSFEGLYGTATETIEGIHAALKNNDLGAAWDVLVKGLTATWKTFTFAFTAAWIEAKKVFVDGWMDAVKTAENTVNNFTAFLMRNDPTGLFSGGMSDADINWARDNENKQLDAAREADQKARDEFRQAQLDAAEMEMNAARDELKKEVQKAKQIQQNAIKQIAEDMLPAITSSRVATRLAANTQGQFSGGTNIPAAQLQEQKKAVEELKANNKKLDELNRNLRFA